jgi:hypothetical protein
MASSSNRPSDCSRLFRFKYPPVSMISSASDVLYISSDFHHHKKAIIARELQWEFFSLWQIFNYCSLFLVLLHLPKKKTKNYEMLKTLITVFTKSYTTSNWITRNNEEHGNFLLQCRKDCERYHCGSLTFGTANPKIQYLNLYTILIYQIFLMI